MAQLAHTFIPDLKPCIFSANPPRRSLPFFRTDYMDSTDCLLLLLSIPFFYFLVFLFFTHFSCRFRVAD